MSVRQWLDVRYAETRRSREKAPERLERYCSSVGLAGVALEESEARECWERLARRVLDSTGKDLSRSREPFVWEALGPYAVPVGLEEPVPITSPDWVMLFEGHPRVAFVCRCRALAVGELLDPFPDLCLAPWPRLNWLLMVPHEWGLQRSFLSLKKR